MVHHKVVGEDNKEDGMAPLNKDGEDNKAAGVMGLNKVAGVMDLNKEAGVVMVPNKEVGEIILNKDKDGVIMDHNKEDGEIILNKDKDGEEITKEDGEEETTDGDNQMIINNKIICYF